MAADEVRAAAEAFHLVGVARRDRRRNEISGRDFPAHPRRRDIREARFCRWRRLSRATIRSRPPTSFTS